MASKTGTRYKAEPATFGASVRADTATRAADLLSSMLEAACPCSFSKLPPDRAANMSRVQLLAWPLDGARAAYGTHGPRWYLGGAQLGKTSCLVSTYDTKKKKMVTRSLTTAGELRGALIRKLKAGQAVIVALHSALAPAPLHDSAARAADPSSSTPLHGVPAGTRLLVSPSMWTDADGGPDIGPEYVMPATLVRSTPGGELTVRIDMHPGKLAAIVSGAKALLESSAKDPVLYMKVEVRSRIARRTKNPAGQMQSPAKKKAAVTQEKKEEGGAAATEESKEGGAVAAPSPAKKRRTKKKLSAKQVHRNERQTVYRADYRARVMVLVCSDGKLQRVVLGGPVADKDKADIVGKPCPSADGGGAGAGPSVTTAFTFNELAKLHHSKRTRVGVPSDQWKALSALTLKEAGNHVTKETTREWAGLSEADRAVFEAKATAIAMAAEVVDVGEEEGEEEKGKTATGVIDLTAQDFSMKRGRVSSSSSSESDEEEEDPVATLPLSSRFARTEEEAVPWIDPRRTQAHTGDIADLMRVEGREVVENGHRVRLYYPLSRQRGVYSTSIVRDNLSWGGQDDYLPPADPTDPAFAVGPDGCVPPRAGLHLTSMRPKLSSISHGAALDLGHPVGDVRAVARWYNEDLHIALPPSAYDRTTHTPAQLQRVPERELALFRTPHPDDPSRPYYMDVNPLYFEQHKIVSYGEFAKRRRDYSAWVAAKAGDASSSSSSFSGSDDGEETE